MGEPKLSAPHPAEQAEGAAAEALAQLPAHAETTLQALRLVDSSSDPAARAALLAMETMLSQALGLSVWLFHIRGEHDRARMVVEVETKIQRGLSEALAREPR